MRLLATALITALLSWVSAASAPAAGRGDSWVTVFYQVTPDHTVRVRRIHDGASVSVSPGHYLEAYLPRSFFPAGAPVTAKAVEQLSPYLLARGFPAGFASMPCGNKADVINRIARQAQSRVQSEAGLVPGRSELGEPIGVHARDLAPGSGSTQIRGVIEEHLEDGGGTGIRGSQNHCGTQDSTPLDSRIEDLENMRFATLVESYEKNPGIEKTIHWAQMEISVFDRETRTSPLKSHGCCEAFVTRALLYGGLTRQPIFRADADAVGGSLRAQGYVNILDTHKGALFNSSRAAPMGAILVYSGGKYGHVAIKTASSGKDGYISDFYTTAPPPPYARKLIGIYVKP